MSSPTEFFDKLVLNCLTGKLLKMSYPNDLFQKFIFPDQSKMTSSYIYYNKKLYKKFLKEKKPRDQSNLTNDEVNTLYPELSKTDFGVLYCKNEFRVCVITKDIHYLTIDGETVWICHKF
jgi:hypothetical protein